MKFKNFAIKVLLGALNIFSKMVIARLPSEWSKKLATLSVVRLSMFGEALTDANPDDKAQIEQITRETLLSKEFQELETEFTKELASKIPNQAIADVLLTTNKLRLDFFAALGDNNDANQEQINVLFADFVKSEDFDTIAISMTTLLADKYAKNDIVHDFIIATVTELVNSDDQV